MAKCLRKEDVELIKNELQEDNFKQHRSQGEKKVNPLDSLVNSLLDDGDVKINQLIAENPALERQTLRQLVRNITSSKGVNKKQKFKNKLCDFLKENNIES
jgi:ribosome-associated protein